MPTDLVTADLEVRGDDIIVAYNHLAASGLGSLHSRGNAFDVGATKLLHFLQPEVFLIVDRNTAGTLRQHGNLPHTLGHSGPVYLQALRFVQQLVRDYGAARFRALEPGTPLARILDKIAFAEQALEE